VTPRRHDRGGVAESLTTGFSVRLNARQTSDERGRVPSCLLWRAAIARRSETASRTGPLLS
jgi:hypothetical protein